MSPTNTTNIKKHGSEFDGKLPLSSPSSSDDTSPSETNSAIESFKSASQNEKQVASDDKDNNINKNNSNNDNEGTATEEIEGQDDSQVLHGTRLTMCVLSTCLVFFLMALDQTITAAILSEISSKFKSFNQIAWITAGFFLGTGALCQIWGQISTIWGRKWVLVLGVFIFEVGSLICALADSMSMLIAGRVIQDPLCFRCCL
ncbi:unnamed protein product [Ambrosiozyma monospora]|uniref:Unnamed protein product n=1 Tax=Ambrosiozyma monospora TaxID=43982 RepID=A0ACB5TCM5_AMBMO|nr:unnamed protein product [Ambrosiozyma monospora]